MAESLENRGKLRELIDKFQFVELQICEFYVGEDEYYILRKHI